MNASLVPEPQFVNASRRIVARTRGRVHGGITRLVSPSDIGRLIKPFVFLDSFDAEPARAPAFGWHPHSGIATLTLLLQGNLTYEETTGVAGELHAGGVEWMRAGGGVWHTGGASGQERIQGYQLWLALPPHLENEPAESRYLSREEVASAGPARVILGSHDGATSRVPAPPGLNYLDVKLHAGERWTYTPPQDHTVLWIAVHEGRLAGPSSPIDAAFELSVGELGVFDESAESISVEASEATGFILGSAVKHPHDLILGNYSVHTHRDALARGEAAIKRIGTALFNARKLR